MSKADELKAAIGKPSDRASALRAAVTGSGKMGEGFLGGVESRIQSMATMFSGDPALRGLPPTRAVPETLSGRMGAATADAAAMAVPFGMMASKVQRPAEAARGIIPKLQGVVSEIGQTFARGPKAFVATEAALGASSGAGGFFAEQAFPNSDAARFIGEVAGGMAPSAVAGAGRLAVRGIDRASNISPTIAAGKQYVARTWDEVARSIDARTAGSRASDRFARAIGDEPAESVLGRMNEPLLPEARRLMTPAQISGNKGLLSLERSVAEAADSLKNKREEDLIQLNEVIKGAFNVGGDVNATSAAMERTRQDYVNLLNERVRIAGLKADESLQRMLPELGEEGANRIARRELESALTEATKQERELFGQIAFDALAPTVNTQKALGEIIQEAGRAGERSVPSYAKDLFDRAGRNFLSDTTSVKELREAQSQLRGIARNARTGTDPDRRLASFADRIANAITDDLAQTQGANPESIKAAVDFSRSRHEVFSQGTVGKILRTASDSGDVIPEMLTLEQTLGAGGPRGAQAVDDIVNAAAFAREKAGYEGAGNLAGAMGNYIQSEFMKSAVRNGQVSPDAASAFLRTNETLLGRFPEIRQGIEEASSAGTAREAQEALRKAGIQTVDDPLVSKASLFINKGPQEAFGAVLNSKSPGMEMQKLIQMAGRDESGEALLGLKQGLFDYLLAESSKGGMVSGSALTDISRSPQGQAAISRLLSDDERNRLMTIARTAQRAEAARAAIPSREGITGDAISRTSEALLGVLGAAYGRQVSSNMGGGTVQIPGIFADRFRELGNMGLTNPAKRLIIDATRDEKLFKEVLMAKVAEDGKLPELATRRLNAWAAATLLREGLNEEENNGN